MNRRWVIAAPDPAQVDELARAVRLPPPLAAALINRGYADRDAARAFLQPRLRDLADPNELPDMPAAVARIQRARRSGERIVIYGDYDVDGLTASALLSRILQLGNADVHNFLPHRLSEGYGLNRAALDRCLRQCQPQLLIAVDCGTTAVAEIARLNAKHIDVIVLDHHALPPVLPAAVALVNPQRCGGQPLAAVGIAFKLAHALWKADAAWASRLDLRNLLELVAVGTIADLVPLSGENRILTKAGLDRLAATDNIGLRAVMETAGVPDEITPAHVGFRIAPRLNAAGRLAHAQAALELLLTTDPHRASELAQLLHAQNAERQRLEEQILEQARAQAEQFATEPVLVLAHDQWHVGVVGIVAARLLQQYYRPTIIIGRGGKGSARSVPGFSIVAALREPSVARWLESFGGHELAAGLTVQPANVPALRAALSAYAAAVLTESIAAPQLSVDAIVKLAELDEAFFAALAQFEPCGVGNPAPVFATRNVTLRGAARVIGKNHLRLTLTDGQATVEAIGWGMASQHLPASRLDVAFVPELHRFRGLTTVRLRLKDLRPAAP